ncbi:MAG: hypothetical protein RMM17_06705 [Acidobacteriota bacterium]|nr:hypothetical protein [Blastocatellia bacterium]MDW8412353.1 hypothetical protein [Acidobacteriota bacterium]
MLVFLSIAVVLWLAVGLPDTPTDELERQRLASLSALRDRLLDPTLRSKSDLTIVVDEDLFNKVLAEYSSREFGSSELFRLKLHNPKVKLRNALALVSMEIEVLSSNSFLASLGKLQAAAQLHFSADNGVLLARPRIVNLAGSGGSAVSLEQINTLLAPISIPLSFNVDKVLQPLSIKQTTPVAFEATVQPRRIAGRVNVLEILPLDKRLVVLAKIREVNVSEMK